MNITIDFRFDHIEILIVDKHIFIAEFFVGAF